MLFSRFEFIAKCLYHYKSLNSLPTAIKIVDNLKDNYRGEPKNKSEQLRCVIIIGVINKIPILMMYERDALLSANK